MHAVPYTLVALSTLLLSIIASPNPTEDLVAFCSDGGPCRANGLCFNGAPCKYQSGVPKAPDGSDGAASSSDDLPSYSDGSDGQQERCGDGSYCGVDHRPSSNVADSSLNDFPSCIDNSCHQGKCSDGSPCTLDLNLKPSSNVAEQSPGILFCSDGRICEDGKCHTSGAPCEGFTFDPMHPTEG